VFIPLTQELWIPGALPLGRAAHAPMAAPGNDDE